MYTVTTPFGIESDKAHMLKALEEARIAFAIGEVPVGAVVVNSAGQVIGRGYNRTESENRQSAHAEISAIQQACEAIGDWRLDGCWLYVTLEPCMMCMGLVLLSRLSGVVFGAQSPLFGCRLDNYELSPVYKKDALQVVQGVCAEETVNMLRQFFKIRRDEGLWSEKQNINQI